MFSALVGSSCSAAKSKTERFVRGYTKSNSCNGIVLCAFFVFKSRKPLRYRGLLLKFDKEKAGYRAKFPASFLFDISIVLQSALEIRLVL